MNASLRAIYILAISAVIFLGGVATFNYVVDPQCFFHCKELDVNRKTVNLYYHVAQRILAHPDAEQVVIGSSRGEGVSGLELAKATGLKTLNLSIGGSEAKSKLAFLEIAQKNLKLKRVIWMADYFELLTDIADPKILFSPALSGFTPLELQAKPSLVNLKLVSKLIDRQTIEASIHQISDHNTAVLDQGPSSLSSYDHCLKPDFTGKASKEVLAKEVDLLYNAYLQQIFSTKENPLAWSAFENEIRKLSETGVEVVIVVPPYNPVFMTRLKEDRPAVFARHLEWAAQLEALKIEHVKVLNFFGGIPDDDGSPRFWDDGVHFSCLGNAVMLKYIVNRK
jgi:hypothetical protein